MFSLNLITGPLKEIRGQNPILATFGSLQQYFAISFRNATEFIIIIIIIIITLIKQIDKMQSYNRDELINVFEKHSVYIVSAISLNSF